MSTLEREPQSPTVRLDSDSDRRSSTVSMISTMSFGSSASVFLEDLDAVVEVLRRYLPFSAPLLGIVLNCRLKKASIATSQPEFIATDRHGSAAEGVLTSTFEDRTLVSIFAATELSFHRVLRCPSLDWDSLPITFISDPQYDLLLKKSISQRELIITKMEIKELWVVEDPSDVEGLVIDVGSADITISCLLPEHAERIDSVWPESREGTLDVIRECILCHPNRGVYVGGELMAWALCFPSGAISVLNLGGAAWARTKGLGRLALAALIRYLVDASLPVFRFVDTNDLAEKRVLESCKMHGVAHYSFIDTAKLNPKV